MKSGYKHSLRALSMNSNFSRPSMRAFSMGSQMQKKAIAKKMTIAKLSERASAYTLRETASMSDGDRGSLVEKKGNQKNEKLLPHSKAPPLPKKEKLKILFASLFSLMMI